ncbi:MAG: dihydrofolate reductase [Pseudomonadales bacterium]
MTSSTRTLNSDHGEGAGMVLLLAMSRNGCIGIDNTLPWHLRDDLLHFKRLTSEHAIIMGRKTYDSIGRALPNRHNIVISRQTALVLEDCEVVNSLDAALQSAQRWSQAHEKNTYYVIGGADVYRQSIASAEQIYLTLVDTEVQGDAWFAFDDADWHQLSRTEFHQNDDNDWNFSILHLSREKP